MEQANALCEWDIKYALGMGLANVHWEGDYPMCPGNGTSQCTQ